MNKINTYFTIGTIGIICTAILQIILTIYISGPVLEKLFFILYPIFIVILAIGFWKIIKEKRTA